MTIDIRFYRSWPSPSEWAEKKLDNVPHVVDDLPKLLIAGQNYKTASELNSLDTDNGWPSGYGFCMLEWDIALDAWSQRQFIAEALLEPREILVAPYRFHDTWCMWQYNDGSGPSLEGRPIQRGEEYCDSFGLGCIYIPKIILNQFLEVMDKFGFTDATFGRWYRERYGRARVTWKVNPQHLHHYPIATNL